ncbi:MAG: rod shape-determining protein RodA [Deltaproteobacteria bacterium]|nr:rod shape-determining protein RodA [Deltaproteobacteria bacterium]
MRILDNEYAKNFDFVIFFTVIIISIIGIINLYGSLSVNHQGLFDPYAIKQIIWFIVAFLLVFAIISIDYNTLIEIAYYIYGFIFILIIAVLLKGRITHGASRWISLGAFSFQPSEFMKIGLIFALVKYLTSYKNKNFYSIKELIIPLIIILLPALLIAKEPDLGTALIVFFAGIIIIYLAGIKRSAILILTGIALFLGPVLWLDLKLYQRNRILIFLHPAKDYLGAGYNIIQSEIAVGAGRLFGNGFSNGSQSTLNFLPAKHTDFVFSTFSQQFGFFGGLILIALYFVLIIRGFEIVYQTKKMQGFLLGAGALSILALHTIINIYMTVGLLPVVGVPLPFFSYGGTSIIVDMSAVAILLNIKMRRYKFQSP